MAACSYTSNHKEVQFSVLVVLCACTGGLAACVRARARVF